MEVLAASVVAEADLVASAEVVLVAVEQEGAGSITIFSTHKSNNSHLHKWTSFH